jgi:hypothetical protein
MVMPKAGSPARGNKPAFGWMTGLDPAMVRKGVAAQKVEGEGVDVSPLEWGDPESAADRTTYAVVACFAFSWDAFWAVKGSPLKSRNDNSNPPKSG